MKLKSFGLFSTFFIYQWLVISSVRIEHEEEMNEDRTGKSTANKEGSAVSHAQQRHSTLDKTMGFTKKEAKQRRHLISLEERVEGDGVAGEVWGPNGRHEGVVNEVWGRNGRHEGVEFWGPNGRREGGAVEWRGEERGEERGREFIVGAERGRSFADLDSSMSGYSKKVAKGKVRPKVYPMLAQIDDKEVNAKSKLSSNLDSTLNGGKKKPGFGKGKYRHDYVKHSYAEIEKMTGSHAELDKTMGHRKKKKYARPAYGRYESYAQTGSQVKLDSTMIGNKKDAKAARSGGYVREEVGRPTDNVEIIGEEGVDGNVETFLDGWDGAQPLEYGAENGRVGGVGVVVENERGAAGAIGEEVRGRIGRDGVIAEEVRGRIGRDGVIAEEVRGRNGRDGVIVEEARGRNGRDGLIVGGDENEISSFVMHQIVNDGADNNGTVVTNLFNDMVEH